VSRMTANRALRELMAEGVVTRIAGVGSFVASQPVRGEMLEIRSIADEIAARGHVHSCRVVARETRPASQVVAEALGQAPGSPVLHTLVLHLEGETPIQIEDRYVNPAIVPDYLAVDFDRETAHAYLSRIAPITRFEHVIEAVLPDGAARRMLALGRTQPCLRLFRRTWSNGVPVTCAWLTHSAALYAVRATKDVPPAANAPSGLP
jgi:GntR family histidine utilization transcriptional repressor